MSLVCKLRQLPSSVPLLRQRRPCEDPIRLRESSIERLRLHAVRVRSSIAYNVIFPLLTSGKAFPSLRFTMRLS